MSKLLKHFIVRFADNRPPPGESRLLGFAATNDPQASQSPEADREAQARQKQVDAPPSSAEIENRLRASVPEVLIPEFTAAVESPEWVQELFNSPGAAQQKIP